MREITAQNERPLPLEQFLRQSFPSLPQKQLSNALSRRDIKRGGKRLGAKDEVLPGDRLQVFIADAYLSGGLPEILYEDQNLLLAVKHPGVSVTEDKRGAPTLQEMVQSRYPSAAACHRLDHNTGGLVVFALNEESRRALEKAFRERTVKKFYRCLVFGKPSPGQALLRGYLKKDADKATVRIFPREVPGSLPVETAYWTLDSCETVSLLRVELITGRTHQIRAHLSSIGHPVCGDDRYGDRAKNKEFRVRTQQLWATELEFHFTAGPLKYLDGRLFTIKPRFSMRGFES